MTVYVGNGVAGGPTHGQPQVNQKARETPTPAAVHAPVREAQPLKDNPRPVASSSPDERPRRDVPRGSYVNLIV
jgi:hypothetical protein